MTLSRSLAIDRDDVAAADVEEAVEPKVLTILFILLMNDMIKFFCLVIFSTFVEPQRCCFDFDVVRLTQV